MIARASKPARRGAALTARLFSADTINRPRRACDDPQSAIRSAIRRRRRTLGLTQEEAAELLGLGRLSYHRIETGRRRIRASELAAICAAYNCHIGELVQDGALARAFLRAAPDLFDAAALGM
ncbi:MAG: helix-turn-helix domain-containing protein [Stellaceae bacterium]